MTNKAVNDESTGSGALRLFAMCAPGLEGVVYDEIASLGVARALAVPGGVEFEGDRATLYRANLWLRASGRVLRRLDRFTAMSFPELARKTKRLPWLDLLPAKTRLSVRAASHGSKLNIKKKIESVIFDTLAERFGYRPAEETEGAPSAAPVATLFVRFDANECVLSIDTSGELLHRRGHREQTGRAPLRETLAAGLLRLAGYDPTEPLVDPMCGAGTIVVEAALMALDRAPGLDREFAFTRFADFDAALWRTLLDEARARVKTTPPAPIIGSDRARSAITAALGNVERAGLAEAVEIRQLDIGESRPPAEMGLVCFNPPYGRRIADPQRLRGVYDHAGRSMHRFYRDWRYGIVVEDDRLFNRMNLKSDAATSILHGGTRVRFHTGRVTAPPTGRKPR